MSVRSEPRDYRRTVAGLLQRARASGPEAAQAHEAATQLMAKHQITEAEALAELEVAVPPWASADPNEWAGWRSQVAKAISDAFNVQGFWRRRGGLCFAGYDAALAADAYVRFVTAASFAALRAAEPWICKHGTSRRMWVECFFQGLAEALARRASRPAVGGVGSAADPLARRGAEQEVNRLTGLARGLMGELMVARLARLDDLGLEGFFGYSPQEEADALIQAAGQAGATYGARVAVVVKRRRALVECASCQKVLTEARSATLAAEEARTLIDEAEAEAARLRADVALLLSETQRLRAEKEEALKRLADLERFRDGDAARHAHLDLEDPTHGR